MYKTLRTKGKNVITEKRRKRKPKKITEIRREIVNMNKNNDVQDEQKSTNKKDKYFVLEVITTVTGVISVIGTLIMSIISLVKVDEVDEKLAQYQIQQQEQQQILESIQSQYQIMQNILNQEQTVDVIQARENDVLIKTPDDKWIVVPMIEKDDIIFPNEIIERQYNAGECEYDRKDLFNKANEDWSKRDSFTYTISYISINQNKMVSLHQFINSIVIECNFYNKERIEHETHAYELYNKELDYDYLNVFYGVTPNVQFVTNEINDGIEDIKINIIIEFEIGGEVFSIPYTFDNWLDVKEDIF